LKAYDEISVKHKYFQVEASDLLEEGILTPPQYKAVIDALPVNFEESNIFAKIGAFIFSILCVSFGLGIITLMTISGEKINFSFVIIFYSLVIIAINEYIIRHSKWYRNGGDNALLYMGLIFFISGIAVITDYNEGLTFLIAIIILILATIRYGDPLVALATFMSYIFYFCFIIFKNQVPYIPALTACGISIITYLFCKNSLKKMAHIYWFDCFKVVEIASLSMIYISVNYYIVDNILRYRPYGEEIPPSQLGYLFVFFTAIIPVAYIILGIKNKDRILWILGSIGLIASIFTYRQYFHVMPIEWALFIAGIILLSLGFFLMTYLKTPRKGIVYIAERGKANPLENIIIGSIIPQSSGNQGNDTPLYGGGDFGGGGASENY
jgi:hypothetical protein